MSEPTISIIVTVHNREHFLDKCIKSVIDQTEVSTELLLIDDGSTDSSLDICQKYQAQYDNIKVFHQENKGISAGRNVGLDNATGDFICFLDDDDSYTPGSFKVMVDAMLTHDADIVVGNYERYEENGDFRCGSNMPENVKNRVITVDEFWEASLDPKGFITFIVNWAKLYKREIWDNLRFPEEYRKSEDEYVLADILAKCSRIYVTDYVVYHQIMTLNSITRADYSITTLRSPETKLKTVNSLIKLQKYPYAAKKWAKAFDELSWYIKIPADQQTKDKAIKLFSISCALGKKLFMHLDTKHKIKLIVYRIVYSRYISRNCLADSEIS